MEGTIYGGNGFRQGSEMFDYDTADAVVRRIIDAFSPEMVIVFGSVARRESGDHSDLDVLVVMDTDLKGAKRAAAVHMRTTDLVMPLDVLVVTPSEFDANKDNKFSFVSEIVRTGVVVYRASHLL